MSVVQSTYRHDIDGLRAIAVLSVIVAHINAQWLSGGFLGVDIFFVISGYLITSIIYREIKGGVFSFANFYTRRIKRILPVFFVVLFSTMPLVYATWEFLDADLMMRCGASAVYFVANFLFGRTADYFDPNMEESVFLHLWSLSVEEQFYFVFPIVLLGLLSVKKIREYILPILSVLMIVSLSLSFFNKELRIADFSSYYYPHLRFGEMLVGSILAIGVIEKRFERVERYMPIIIPMAVLLLASSLAWGSIFVIPAFPGPLALVPCLSVAALLYPQSRVKYVARALSWSPLVWIGKISYSLYLWHWVILAYVRYFLDTYTPLSGQMIVVVVVLMFALSILTYYLVERPIRSMDLSFKKSLVYIYVIPALVYTGAYLYSRSSRDTYQYWDKELVVRTMTEDPNALMTGELLGDSLQSKPSILVAGDSHTLHLTGFFHQLGQHEGWKALVSYRPGTPFLTTGIGRENTGSERDQGDVERYHFLMKQLHQYDKIVLSAFWDIVGDREMGELDKTLSDLRAWGKEIVMINTMSPVGRIIRRDFHSPKTSRFIHLIGGYDYPIKEITVKRSKRIAEVEELLKRHPNVRWIDLSQLLPKSGAVGDKFVYPDNAHINYFAAEWLAKEFIRSGQTLFSESKAYDTSRDESKALDE